MKNTISLLLFLAVLVLAGCTTSQDASRQKEDGVSSTAKAGKASDDVIKVDAAGSGQTLYDYLRKVPGLTVSGSPNSPQVRIRGASSAALNTNPLIVLDGVALGNDFGQLNSMLHPNDIASVQVLKDASSTAAYGSRGANGVVVIKRRKAKD